MAYFRKKNRSAVLDRLSKGRKKRNKRCDPDSPILKPLQRSKPKTATQAKKKARAKKKAATA